MEVRSNGARDSMVPVVNAPDRKPKLVSPRLIAALKRLIVKQEKANEAFIIAVQRATHDLENSLVYFGWSPEGDQETAAESAAPMETDVSAPAATSAASYAAEAK